MASGEARRSGRTGRILRRLAALLLAVVVVAPAAVWLLLRASLPALDGDLVLDGLRAPVTVTRDALGVVTVSGANRIDVARATGFVHAQDRFFQMDLMRRDAAGELSALAGAVTVAHDLERRLHASRRTATAALALLSARHRRLLEAYAAGVNAWLAALRVPPPEYLMLPGDATPWRAEDTLLVALAMFYQLTDEDADRDAARGRLYAALDRRVADFLVPSDSAWNAPLDGSRTAESPVPPPTACDLRAARRATDTGRAAHAAAVGSNAWALGGRHTASGVPLLANDMHLGLRVPNTWYRMRLRVAAGAGQALDVSGVTLPGAPVVVVGSNGRIAWGFTNSYGDWSDRVVLELDAGGAPLYRTPDGPREFVVRREAVEVAGGETRQAEFLDTIWGPVVASRAGRPRQALRWLGDLPAALDLGLMDLESAADVGEALAAAHRAGAPPQNFHVVDADGGIAWSILGRLPRRVGYDPTVPSSWADGAGWQGWVAAPAYPVLLAPNDGRLWTANSRVVGGRALALIGEGGYYPGARARQIRDRLLALERATPADMLALQLDDRAIFLERWQRLLLATLDESALAAVPERAAMREEVAEWGGRARPDSTGYRLVREFRRELQGRLLGALLEGCAAPGVEGLTLAFERRSEGPLWRLVSERPAHLLPPGHADWREALLAAADAVRAACPDGPLAECTWGAFNHVRIAHPLHARLGPLGGWLVVQDGPLPGDDFMPRVQRERQGASQRMAVSPGLEAEGYLHMPGGQSGHPMSPFFRAGHEAWARGEPLPFLPGPSRHTLHLLPATD